MDGFTITVKFVMEYVKMVGKVRKTPYQCVDMERIVLIVVNAMNKHFLRIIALLLKFLNYHHQRLQLTLTFTMTHVVHIIVIVVLDVITHDHLIAKHVKDVENCMNVIFSTIFRLLVVYMYQKLVYVSVIIVYLKITQIHVNNLIHL